MRIVTGVILARFKYIDGIKVGSNAIDLTGQRFGRLVINSLHGRHPTRVNNPLVWSCMCDCGNAALVVSAELSAGHTVSCGCYMREVNEIHQRQFKAKYETHGWAGTREHKAWKRIKQRCLNKNSQDYEVYSKIGIGDDIAADFMTFLDAIGEIPKDMPERVSIDRIDNTKGYVVGNIQWATDEQQARNKGKYANNTSGITGVYKHTSKYGKESWVANWYEYKGRQRSKAFSIDKYGDELAFFAACECRGLIIERLNLAGAGYTENHGK